MKNSKGSSATGPITGNGNSHERVSFSLSGRSPELDRRTNAYRDDVADLSLAGKVLAHYYAVPMHRSITVASANLFEEQSLDAQLGSQLLFGEAFAVVDMTDGWSWGFGLHDHYVGYLETAALGAPSPASHIVIEHGVEIDGIGEIPLASRVTDDIAASLGKAARPLHAVSGDPLAIAESFVGSPYLWGGRTRAGIDCSGLVQVAFALAGHGLPRDSDQQLEAIDNDVAEQEMRRGDIVFFPDHVGLLADSETLLHATRHHGAVVAEPLTDVVARISDEHERPIIGLKRISG